MERVAETAELLGVEASIGTSKLEIGHATKDFIAGGVSGMVGICAGQPLDTMRVRLQQKGCQQASAAEMLRASGSKAGVRDLFRGMSYPLYTIALQNAVTFQAQGAAARLLTGSDSKTLVSWQDTCISGMFAGAMSSFISSPTELLKIRMQLQKAMPGTPGYLGPWGMLQQVVRHEGVLGLSRGLGMTLVRDTPSYGVYFCIYHFSVQGLGQLLYRAPTLRSQNQQQQQQQQQQRQQQQQQQPGRDELRQHHTQHLQKLNPAAQSTFWQEEQQSGQLTAVQQQQQPSQNSHQQQQQQNPGASQPVVQFLAGGLAGALAWMSIYPMDVIKCRMQASSRQASAYRGAWDCTVSSWRQEGPRVFVKGLGATMGRGFVVNAAIFAAFEAVMDAMNA